jgi:hypothetical protein
MAGSGRRYRIYQLLSAAETVKGRFFVNVVFVDVVVMDVVVYGCCSLDCEEIWRLTQRSPQRVSPLPTTV